MLATQGSMPNSKTNNPYVYGCQFQVYIYITEGQPSQGHMHTATYARMYTYMSVGTYICKGIYIYNADLIRSPGYLITFLYRVLVMIISKSKKGDFLGFEFVPLK